MTPKRGDPIRVLEGALRDQVLQVIAIKPRARKAPCYDLRSETGHTWVVWDMPAWEPVLAMVRQEQEVLSL